MNHWVVCEDVLPWFCFRMYFEVSGSPSPPPISWFSFSCFLPFFLEMIIISIAFVLCANCHIMCEGGSHFLECFPVALLCAFRKQRLIFWLWSLDVWIFSWRCVHTVHILATVTAFSLQLGSCLFRVLSVFCSSSVFREMV